MQKRDFRTFYDTIMFALRRNLQKLPVFFSLVALLFSIPDFSPGSVAKSGNH